MLVRRRIPVLIVLAVVLFGAVSSGGVGEAQAPRAEVCVDFAATVEPPEAGSIVSITPANCPNVGEEQKYLADTVVTIELSANDDWQFAIWAGGPVSGGLTGTILLSTDFPDVRAYFASELEPGVTSPATVATGAWRYFFFDAPAGLTELKATTSGTGDVDLYTNHDAPPDETTFQCRQISPDSSDETCDHDHPAGGRWWIGAHGVVGGNISITLDLCVPLDAAVSPPGGGTIELDPLPSCNGGYPLGTDVTVTAVPNPGFQFGRWDGDLCGCGAEQTLTMDDDKAVLAEFGQEVQPNVPVTDVALAPGDVLLFVTHIPADTALMEVEVTGTGDVTLRTLIDEPPDEFSNFCEEDGPSALPLCGEVLPERGSWWFELTGNAASTVDFEVVAQLAACQPLTFEASPPEGGTVDVTPDPDCAGDLYNTSTPVTVTAQPNAGFIFATWSGDLTSQNTSEVVTMSDAREVIAHFASELEPGVTETGFVATDAWRYYYIDVPADAGGLKVEMTDDTDGDPDLYTRFGVPPTLDEFDCAPYTADSLEVCNHTTPQAGRWWVAVNGYEAGDYSLTVTLGAICLPVEVVVLPPGGGTAEVEGPDGCAQEGEFPLGSTVTLTAQPTEGYALVAWVVNGFPEIDNPLEFFLDEDTEIDVYFGAELTSGVEVPVAMESASERFFYIDVPAGVAALAFETTRPDGVDVLVESFWDNVFDPRCLGANACYHIAPDAGRWWFVGIVVGPATIGFRATFGDDVCVSLPDISVYPAGAGTLAIAGDECAEEGTYPLPSQVQVLADPADGFAFAGIGPDFPFSETVLQQPGLLDIGTNDHLHAYFGTAVHSGDTLLDLPELDFHWRYISVPPGTQALEVEVDPDDEAIILVRHVDESAAECEEFITSHYECLVSSPEPGRWWIAVVGNEPVDLAVTLTPAPDGPVVDWVSITHLVFGSGPVTFSVHGTGFDATSVVRWDGAALDTEFVSATELRATIGRDGTQGPARTVVIDVVNGGVQLRAEGTSNPVGLLLLQSRSDATCNGVTDANDVTKLLGYLVGSEDLGACGGDANGDGVADLADALFVMREVAGMEQPKGPFEGATILSVAPPSPGPDSPFASPGLDYASPFAPRPADDVVPRR